MPLERNNPSAKHQKVLANVRQWLRLKAVEGSACKQQ
jgi:hypothetical protein